MAQYTLRIVWMARRRTYQDGTYGATIGGDCDRKIIEFTRSLWTTGSGNLDGASLALRASPNYTRLWRFLEYRLETRAAFFVATLAGQITRRN